MQWNASTIIYVQIGQSHSLSSESESAFLDIFIQLKLSIGTQLVFVCGGALLMCTLENCVHCNVS